MEPSFLDVALKVLDAGGTLALAVFAIWMLNRVWADRVAAEQRHAEQVREMWQQMQTVVQNNTQAITELCTRLGGKGNGS